MILTINQLEREAATGIIHVIHWHASKTAGNHTATSYGTVRLTAGEFIIPFEQVTEANVLAWLQNALNTQAMETSLDTQLAALANPPVLTGFPWVAQQIQP